MEIVDAYHWFADQLVTIAGGSDKMVHVHAGLALYYAMQILFRRRRASWASLQAVVAFEVANEVMDRLFWGDWRWADTSMDVAATMFWPTIIFSVGTYRRRRWNKKSGVRSLYSPSQPFAGQQHGAPIAVVLQSPQSGTA
jgi:hypothetical protein